MIRGHEIKVFTRCKMFPYLNDSLAVAVHLVNGCVVQDLVPVITLLLSGDQYRDSKGIIYLLI